jgi:hypothetical protein
MSEIFNVIEDLSLPVMAVLLSEFVILASFGVMLNRITAHSIKNISNSIDKLDECVKTIGDELDEVVDAVHDLTDHQ